MENDRTGARLKDILGWASLGLAGGLLAAPSAVARLTGLPDDERTHTVLRAVGLRELLAYVLIERTGPTAAVPLWVRTGGDALDLALLCLGSGRKGAEPKKVAVAAANVAAIAALDAYTAIRLGRSTQGSEPAGPPDDLSKDPAYEPPEPFRGIKGG
jgi:hypothetical protein